MTRDRKSSFRDVGEELDRRLGGLLGEVGASLGEVLSRLDDLGDGEIIRERDFDTGRGAVRAGIRVRMGGRGETLDSRGGANRPVDQPFEPDPAANAAPPGSQDRPPNDTVRAIEATILDVDGTWSLIADLPGVEASGIDLSDTGPGGDLILSAEGRHRKYAGRFDLPKGVSASDLSVSLVNGILELRATVPSP